MDKSESLVQKIEAGRIRYPETESGGVTIEGRPFVCEFKERVDAETFCEEIIDPDEPFHMFGVKTPISDDGYWKVAGNLLVIEDGHLQAAPKVTLEVTDEWMRVYVKGETPAERVAEFVRAVDAEYGVDVRFGDE